MITEFDKRCIIRLDMRDSGRHNGELVHREILDYLKEMDVAGATVIHGLAGFFERRFVKGGVCELPKRTDVVTTMIT